MDCTLLRHLQSLKTLSENIVEQLAVSGEKRESNEWYYRPRHHLRSLPVWRVFHIFFFFANIVFLLHIYEPIHSDILLCCSGSCIELHKWMISVFIEPPPLCEKQYRQFLARGGKFNMVIFATLNFIC